MGRRVEGTRAPWTDHGEHGPHEHPVPDGSVPLGAGHVAHLHILRLRDSSIVLLGARGLRDEVTLGPYWLNTRLL